jgi:hypothetical protein
VGLAFLIVSDVPPGDIPCADHLGRQLARVLLIELREADIPQAIRDLEKRG